MKINISKNKPPRIEMLPLIDVVFLLLVVFIYAMLSMAVHKGMPVSLPESSAVMSEKEIVLQVTINKARRIFVNKEPVDLEYLTRTLEKNAKKHNKPSVLLFADKGITYQTLFNILDRIRMAGLNQISLQADPEGPKN